MRVAIVNYVWDARAPTPEATLERFATLTGWSDALIDAGALSVNVFQRFHRDADLVRGGVTYSFRGDNRLTAPRPSAWFSGADRLHAAAAGINPDIVHVNGLEYPALMRGLRRAVPPACAIVAQDHGGFDPLRLSRVRKAWLRRGLGAADALLVASPGQAGAFRRSRLLPGPVALFDVMESSTAFRPTPREAAREASGVEGSPALLWVGRLNANKDPLTVLRGLERFVETHPSAGMTFVYRDADLEPVVRREIAATPALGARVRLVGQVDHARLASFYSATDLFVIGSHHEGSGYAVIEAMACGAIPVVSDIPSFRTLTDEGRVGALWTPGDARALDEALVRVMARSLTDQRAATRARFEDRFSWRAIGARAMDIYRDVIARRASRS